MARQLFWFLLIIALASWSPTLICLNTEESNQADPLTKDPTNFSEVEPDQADQLQRSEQPDQSAPDEHKTVPPIEEYIQLFKAYYDDYFTGPKKDGRNVMLFMMLHYVWDKVSYRVERLCRITR